jgi:hypothetical protein
MRLRYLQDFKYDLYKSFIVQDPRFGQTMGSKQLLTGFFAVFIEGFKKDFIPSGPPRTPGTSNAGLKSYRLKSSDLSDRNL